MNQEKIGNFISKLRKEKKLTQEELAEKLHISSKSISRWETGKCMPDISLLIPLSEILEVSVNELITGESIEDENFKEKTEEVLKETLNYSKERINKEKKKITWIIISLIFIISIILGTIDYNKIKYGEEPLFMIRISSNEKKLQHYIGLGYRLERKINVSSEELFSNSKYIRFGPWIYTWEVNVIKAEPPYLYLKANSNIIKANRGGYCWSEKNLFVCADTLGPSQMKYEEKFKLSKKDIIEITNLYGNIEYINAYEENKEEPINLKYKDNKITIPNKQGTYYIVINIKSKEGKVWHSCQLEITE